jgi:F0F1-type ATP synthase membrane subunit c/vacuolar-type H+-ATPase subunit K
VAFEPQDAPDAGQHAAESGVMKRFLLFVVFFATLAFLGVVLGLAVSGALHG